MRDPKVTKIERMMAAELKSRPPEPGHLTKAQLRQQLVEAARNTAALAHGKRRSEQAGSPR